VRTRDFPDEPGAKAIPYGVYDLAANAGGVSAGTGHDTAASAAGSIRRWWNAVGQAAYPGARRLLITAELLVDHEGWPACRTLSNRASSAFERAGTGVSWRSGEARMPGS
jgi:hypothetical protein